MDGIKDYIETSIPNAADINLCFQSRVKLNQDRINLYFDTLVDKMIWVFPPIDLVQGKIGDREELILTDGYHRYLAACQYGSDKLAEIPCRIYKTPVDMDAVKYATLKSSGSNSEHGLNRGEEDIKKAVTMTIEVLGPGISARTIADIVKISPTTASKYIKLVLGQDVQSEVKGMDGKIYKQRQSVSYIPEDQKEKESLANTDVQANTVCLDINGIVKNTDKSNNIAPYLGQWYQLNDGRIIRVGYVYYLSYMVLERKKGCDEWTHNMAIINTYTTPEPAQKALDERVISNNGVFKHSIKYYPTKQEISNIQMAKGDARISLRNLSLKNLEIYHRIAIQNNYNSLGDYVSELLAKELSRYKDITNAKSE